jgi:hypothetical protein
MIVANNQSAQSEEAGVVLKSVSWSVGAWGFPAHARDSGQRSKAKSELL